VCGVGLALTQGRVVRQTRAPHTPGSRRRVRPAHRVVAAKVGLPRLPVCRKPVCVALDTARDQRYLLGAHALSLRLPEGLSS
jgi:hypothetical protein